jgi:hypothetical protein
MKKHKIAVLDDYQNVANTAIVETVDAITRGQSAPDANHLGQILQNSR